jgi:hypothetical protein
MHHFIPNFPLISPQMVTSLPACAYFSLMTLQAVHLCLCVFSPIHITPQVVQLATHLYLCILLPDDPVGDAPFHLPPVPVYTSPRRSHRCCTCSSTWPDTSSK